MRNPSAKQKAQEGMKGQTDTMDRFRGIDEQRRLNEIRHTIRCMQEINRNVQATDEDVVWMLKRKEEELRDLERVWLSERR